MIGLLNTLLDLILHFLKVNLKKKTPYAKSKDEIKKAEQAIADGDGDRLGVSFDELCEDADRFDTGQPEADQSDRREVEG